MPSVSAKQKRFMAAAANNPKFAKEAGIDQSVAREFFQADQAKKKTRDDIARTMMKAKPR
jgi:hypothetical protein